MSEGRQDVVYSQDGISEGIDRNPDENELHHKKAGDGVTLGGAAADFEVCEREKGYEGRGHRKESLWRQEEAETKLMKTLDEISW